MSAWLIGFDGSEYQEDITWPEVPPGGYFGIIKISEGTTYVDRKAARNVPGARSIKNPADGGWLPFWYHYADGADPVVEAQHFLATLASFGGLQDYEGLAYDFEISGVANPGSYTKAFEDYVEAQVGIRPWLYSTRYLLSIIYKANPKSPIWLADPDDPPTQNAQYLGATVPYVYAMQQYGTGSMPGVPVAVDIDYFFGTFIELRDYTKQPAVAPAAPVAPVPEIAPVPAPTTPVPSPTPSTVVSPQAIDIVKSQTPPAHAPAPTPPSVVAAIETDAAFVITRYNKFIVAAAGAVATYIANHYGANHLVSDGLVILAACGVIAIPNVPK